MAVPSVGFDALLFDLFGTVVQFAATVPFERFLESIGTVTKEIVAGRSPEYLEISSPERFRRALELLGLEPALAVAIGQRLSAAHMLHIGSQTVLPAGHRELLERLGKRYRVGLVSNFDSGPTAARVLQMHGVDHAFASVTISDGFGRRKPHPAIFLHAVEELGATPDHTLFIGDSFTDDVVGAKAAGLAVAWINADAEMAPTQEPRADYIIAALADLEELLG